MLLLGSSETEPSPSGSVDLPGLLPAAHPFGQVQADRPDRQGAADGEQVVDRPPERGRARPRGLEPTEALVGDDRAPAMADDLDLGPGLEQGTDDAIEPAE